MLNQYGRKYALWVALEGFRDSRDPLGVHVGMLGRAVARLKDEDLGELYKLIPRESHEDLKEFLAVGRECGNTLAELSVPANEEDPLVSNQGG
jgi:hypothetical protein